MSFEEEFADLFEIPPEATTRSLMFLFGTLSVYVVSGGITILPSVLQVALAVVFLVFWLGCPIALHYDRKFVADTTDWTPSKWYYLSVFPGYLGIAFLAVYLYKRSGW